MNMRSEAMGADMQRMRRLETEKIPDFSLTVVVHRHGPKEGQNGPLKESGKEEVREYFSDAYEGVVQDDEETGGVDIVHSPILRAAQTANIEAEVIRSRGGKVKSVSVENRLNEGELSRYEEKMKQLGGGKGKWLNGWMALTERPEPDVKTGKETAAGVAEWLLELADARKKSGGAQEVEAISHFPVLAAFLMRLHETSGLPILPDDWMQTSPAWTHLDLLRYFTFSVDKQSGDTFRIFFHGKSHQVPMDVLREMAKDMPAEDFAIAAK